MKKLGFGMMRLPLADKDDSAKIDMKQVERMVDTFLERGFTYFDTAYMYHNNQSEIAVREAVVKRHPRDSFTVATKLPTMYLKEPGDQERIFDEQRRKCGVEYFDYYLLHNINRRVYETVQRLDSFGYASRLREEGKIGKLGFSFHDDAQTLDRVLTEHPEVDFVQLQINYLDWDSENVQSGRCHEVAVSHGKSIVVMEPVKGGALANLPEEAETLLRKAAPEASPASWAIRFAASQENVFMVLSGMSTMEQLEDNTGFMSEFKPLTKEEREILHKVLEIIRSSVTVPCTACRYCVAGCPMNIPIPELFAMYNTEQRSRRFHLHSNAREEYAALKEKGGMPGDCIQCRACEGSCPQHLEISELLKDVAKTFKEQEK